MTLRLALIGAGGHVNDVLDCVDALNAVDRGAFEVVGLLADVPPNAIATRRLASRRLAVIGTVSDLSSIDADAYVIAIGYPRSRAAVAARTDASPLPAATLVDPRAERSVGCEFGRGAVVLGPSRISSFASVGNHVLVSYHVAIGHGCRVGDLASVMPGAVIGGEVTIGSRSLIGAGAIILENRIVGADSTVGAGAVVTTDVDPGTTVVGVPARPVT